MFWKACNKQTPWECLMCMGCNQQWLVTDSERTRSWSGIPKSTVYEILMEDLGMKCVAAKFILWLLLSEQKEHHAAVANDLIQTATRFGTLWLWLFSKLKSPLKGKWFQTVSEIQQNSMGQWWRFQQKILLNVLNSGRDAGRSVWGPKVPI